MLAALVVLVAVTGSPAKEFGLEEGATWTYRVSSSEGKPFEDVVTARTERAAGRIVFELKGKSIEHFGADDSGLYQYAPAHMDGTGIASGVEPELIVKKSAMKGETWKWIRPFRGQVMAGPDGKGPDMEKLKADVTAEIISTGESIRWGSNSSTATHVRITAVRRDGEKSVTDSWYTKSVGLVREREQWGRYWFQRDLTSYGIRLGSPE